MIVGIAGNCTVAHCVLDCIDGRNINVVDVHDASACPTRLFSKLIEVLKFFVRLLRVDVLFICYPVRWTSLAIWMAKLMKKKVVLYWIGTDVLNLLDGKIRIDNANNADLVLACSNQLVSELIELGITAHLLYTPTDLDERIVPMPNEHAVLLNIPDSRKEFYGYETICKLIEDYPDTRFIITRSNDPSLYPFPNVEFRGMLDRDGMEKVFADTSICIRYPKHDGMALSIVEAMAKGRTVICNQPVPFTLLARTYDELSQALDRALSTPPSINFRAHDYALEEFSRNKCRNTLADYFHTYLGY